LIPQSLFVWSLHTETGIILYTSNDTVPLNLRNIYKRLNSKERDRLEPALIVVQWDLKIVLLSAFTKESFLYIQ
jgi:hypothetical protein